MRPSSPSPSGKFRILEIKVESADLNVKKKGRLYVKLAIHPDRELQTNVKYWSRGSKPVWDEKFIVLVPHEEFLGSENKDNALLVFQIFRARKFLEDKLIGTTRCDLMSLMFQLHQQQDVDEDEDDDVSIYFDASDQEECSFSDYDYDDDDQEEEEEEPRYLNMFRAEDDEIHLKNDILESKNDNADMLETNNDGDMLETKMDEMNLGTLSRSFSLTVGKGLECKGKLKIEVAVSEGTVSCIGKYKWRNAAMPYDEFLGLINPNYLEGDKKKKKIRNKRSKVHLSFCFTGSAVSV